MMNRIATTLRRLKTEGKKALIPYITPEFPVKGITIPLLRELEKSGADLVEIGIPFSDPLADGTTIQHSSEVALQHGVHIGTILADVSKFRDQSDMPVLLMGYINPILHFGVEKFMKQSAAAGVDGLIIPDLPPEEADEVRKQSAQHGVSNVFLIAPTTQNARMQKIDEYSTDFSYCVSVTGVTGARNMLGMNGSLEDFLQRVRQNVQKPFVVGFGISKAEHVRRVWQYADGAVVGSALMNAISKASTRKDALARAGRFLRSLKTS